MPGDCILGLRVEDLHTRNLIDYEVKIQTLSSDSYFFDPVLFERQSGLPPLKNKALRSNSIEETIGPFPTNDMQVPKRNTLLEQVLTLLPKRGDDDTRQVGAYVLARIIEGGFLDYQLASENYEEQGLHTVHCCG